MLRNIADARRCSYFELGLPVDPSHKINSVPSVNLMHEEGWYGQPKYCHVKTIHVVLISFAVVFGLLVFFFWFL